MTLLTGLLSRLVGQKLAPLASYLLVFALIGGALWWMHHAAYRKGRADENAAWEQAIAKADQQSARAAAGAEQGAVARQASETERVKAEKEKIDAAASKGDDPFDVLFASSGS